MTKEQIEDLLDNVLEVTKRNPWKGSKIQFNCPIHGESHPSCGIDSDYIPDGDSHFQVFHCFSCGESGGLAWLLYRAKKDDFKNYGEAVKFLSERYNVDIKSHDRNLKKSVKRYEDFYTSNTVEESDTISRSFIAPFKSGKETYEYFINRGFSQAEIEEYSVGRDLVNETVTIPVFNENKELVGVIGRYIDKNRPKNSRYKIYEFPKGNYLFPIDKLEVNDSIIVTEGMFDTMMMRKWGYKNTVSIMGNSISKKQAEMLKEICNKLILLFDNDSGGRTAIKIAEKRFRGSGVLLLVPCYYPEIGKDPIEWGEAETDKVINSVKVLGVSGIKRL